jgi:hypothetical protein
VGAIDQLRTGARRAAQLPRKAGEQVSHATVLPRRAAGRARRSVSRATYGVADRVRSLRPGEGGSTGAAVEPAGDGILNRARANPLLAMAIAGGAVLLLAWIGWAIYVTSAHGASAGLGVVIAWPALLAALALISLPFIGGWFLVQRLRTDEGEAAVVRAEEAEEVEDDEGGDDAEDDEAGDGDGDTDAGNDADEGEDGERESSGDSDTSEEAKASTSG